MATSRAVRESTSVETFTETNGTVVYFLPGPHGEIAVRLSPVSGDLSARAPKGRAVRVRGLWEFPGSDESVAELEFVDRFPPPLPGVSPDAALRGDGAE